MVLSVITVTPNAALDVTYFVRGFRAGGVYRALSVAKKAGGKGLNVARAVRTLGGDPLATGFAGGPTGERILEGLSREGIRARFVRTAGESRCTIAVVDEETGAVTEIREAGEAVSGEELAEFLSWFGDICRSAVSRSGTESEAGSCEVGRPDEPRTASCFEESSRVDTLPGRPVVVFSGSLRPGLVPDFYAKLIKVAKSCGFLTILDTGGHALRSGVAAGPFLVKPNLTEAQELVGMEHGTPDDAEEAFLTRAATALASRIASYGPQVVVLSMGKHGAVMHHKGRTWSGRVRIDDVRNPVGSGDSMVGGMAWALARGEDIVEAFRLGVACGAANALTATAGEFRMEDVTALLEQVEVRSYGSCKP